MKQETKEGLFYFIIGVIFLLCFSLLANSARAEAILVNFLINLGE